MFQGHSWVADELMIASFRQGKKRKSTEITSKLEDLDIYDGALGMIGWAGHEREI